MCLTIIYIKKYIRIDQKYFLENSTSSKNRQFWHKIAIFTTFPFSRNFFRYFTAIYVKKPIFWAPIDLSTRFGWIWKNRNVKCLKCPSVYLSVTISGICYFWNFISRVPLRIKGWNFFWMKFKLLRSNVPKIMKKFHREVGHLNFWKSRKIGWELFLHIYWFWQSTFVKFCEYFQMEILGVVDYYFGLIKGIGALSGAGWGSPLWACQPTDIDKM